MSAIVMLSKGDSSAGFPMLDLKIYVNKLKKCLVNYFLLFWTTHGFFSHFREVNKLGRSHVVRSVCTSFSEKKPR